MNAIRKVSSEKVSSEMEAVERAVEREIAELIALHKVIAVLRPDGQIGYAWAPPLPCVECGGSGFSPDADFGDLEGLCMACHGTGIQE